MEKKGASKLISLLVFAAVIIIAGIIWAFIFKGGATDLAGVLGGQISALGDCDGDGFPNGGFASTKDQCPCIPTGGKGSDTFKGCPVGTTQETANNDQNTCGHFVVEPYGEDDETFKTEELCDDANSESDKKCVAKCEIVKKIAEATAGSSKQIVLDGRKCDCDIVIEKFQVKHDTQTVVTEGGNEGKLIINMQNKKQVEIKVGTLVKNTNEEFSETIKTQLYLCDSNKKNCDKIGAGKSYAGSEAFKEELEEEPIVVGKDGDACDGPGSISCHLKLTVDFGESNVLNEGLEGEKNNVAYVKLQLDGQDYDQHAFPELWTVELVINDEGGPNPEVKEIAQVCSGYIGQKSDSDGYTCDSEDASCESGEFPSRKDRFPASNGCLVVISEVDQTSNNCGYFGVKSGFVIPVAGGKVFNSIQTPYKHTDGNDADNALAYQWYHSKGSLLCNEGYWYQCDSSGEKKKFFTSYGTSYSCKNKHWS